MKNIHVLPTEKPSRLYLFEERLILGDLVTVVFKNSGAVNQNIYITSDEEIKEGDYVINSAALYVFQHYFAEGNLYKECKKIILTTDQDLIKDGVQAIDDDFLEWFVNNPSCEMVKVVLDDTSFVISDIIYKIIIPKEEPKQEGYICPHTKLQCDDECCVSASDCHIKTTIGIISEPKQEFTKPKIIDNWLEKNGDPEIAKQVEQEAVELFANQSTKDRILSETSEHIKQKAKDYANSLVNNKETIDGFCDLLFLTYDFNLKNRLIAKSFIQLGAKWQQEQDKNKFSENDISTAIAMYLENKSFSEIIKQLKNK